MDAHPTTSPDRERNEGTGPVLSLVAALVVAAAAVFLAPAASARPLPVQIQTATGVVEFYGTTVVPTPAGRRAMDMLAAWVPRGATSVSVDVTGWAAAARTTGAVRTLSNRRASHVAQQLRRRGVRATFTLRAGGRYPVRGATGRRADVVIRATVPTPTTTTVPTTSSSTSTSISTTTSTTSTTTTTTTVPTTDPVTATITVGNIPTGMAYDGSNVWVANYNDGTISRIDPATNTVTATVTVGSTPYAVTFDGSSLWVTNQGGGTVTKVDPATSTVATTVTVGGSPTGAVFGSSSVWVTNLANSTVSRISP